MTRMASCGSMKQRGIAPLTVRGASDGTMCAVAGRYESWFLSARDEAARAIWVRHTRHGASAALWCTVFDAAAGPPAAVKQSVDAFPAGARAGADGFRGEARARG